MRTTKLNSKLRPVQRSQPSASGVPVTIRIQLPEEVFTKYGENEDTVAARLQKCADHTAEIPIYLDDEQRQNVMNLLSMSKPTPEELIARVSELVRFRVGDVAIQLTPGEISRIESRRLGGQSFEDILTQYVMWGIRSQTGLL